MSINDISLLSILLQEGEKNQPITLQEKVWTLSIAKRTVLRKGAGGQSRGRCTINATLIPMLRCNITTVRIVRIYYLSDYQKYPLSQSFWQLSDTWPVTVKIV